jgi:hypothetical protein
MFTSADRQWRVKPIKRNGVDLLRVEHKGVEGMPYHQVDNNRCGPVRTGDGWWLAEDVRSIGEVAKWVPLKELSESVT